MNDLVKRYALCHLNFFFFLGSEFTMRMVNRNLGFRDSEDFIKQEKYKCITSLLEDAEEHLRLLLEPTRIDLKISPRLAKKYSLATRIAAAHYHSPYYSHNVRDVYVLAYHTPCTCDKREPCYKCPHCSAVLDYKLARYLIKHLPRSVLNVLH
jgi:hypothetical protein